MKTLLLSLLISTATCFAGEKFTVDQSNPSNLISFTSKAPLEEVVGRTNSATGFIILPNAASQGSSEIHVDLASLTTGLSLRDRHMRENHLETDQFPEAVFTLTSLELPGGVLTQGKKTSVKVYGTMFLHGVAKEMNPITWLTLTGDDLVIESKFSVSLQDYNITRPEFLIMKLADDQRIDVKLTARRTP